MRIPTLPILVACGLRRLAEAPDFEVVGMSLTEVGRVRIVADEPPYHVGRIVKFLGSESVESGDVLAVPESRD